MTNMTTNAGDRLIPPMTHKDIPLEIESLAKWLTVTMHKNTSSIFNGLVDELFSTDIDTKTHHESSTPS
jgi:hypothetical protein